MEGIGKLLVIAGLIIAFFGIAIILGPKLPFLGRLPGDIYFKKENFSLYFPITTSLLISLLLSFILYLFKR
ncbi:MAG: DUF2905 domain-containing protein [Thermodesulfobacteriota bacterium]|nr:DUF2905 domain-containing protein [Thermodesulfobacteriota bacterium]